MAGQHLENLFRRFKGEVVDVKTISGGIYSGRISEITNDYVCLIETAGSHAIGDAVFDEIFHPIAERLARRCDAVLRIGGASAGADAMVRIFAGAGRTVFRSLDEIAPAS